MENKLAIFKIFVRSVLTYGILIFCAASRTNMKKMQTTQNKALRAALNLRPDPTTYRQKVPRTFTKLPRFNMSTHFV